MLNIFRNIRKYMYLYVLITMMLIILFYPKKMNSIENFYTQFTPYYVPMRNRGYGMDVTNIIRKFVKFGSTNEFNDMIRERMLTLILRMSNIKNISNVKYENEILVQNDIYSNKLDIGVISEPQLYHILKTNMKFISKISKKHLFMVTTRYSGIFKFDDAIGRRYRIGIVDNDIQMWKQYMEAFDITDTDGYVVYRNVDNAIKAMIGKNSEIDVIMFSDYFPNENVINLLNREMIFIQFPKREVKYFRREYINVTDDPRYESPIRRRVDMFSQNNVFDYHTLSYCEYLITNDKLENEIAHTIIKQLYKNIEYMNELYVFDFAPRDILFPKKEFSDKLLIHDGCLKYLDGLIKV